MTARAISSTPMPTPSPARPPRHWHLTVFLSHSHQSAWSIGDVVPLDAGTELRIVAVLLHTQALAVQEEFHLVAIGIGIERNQLACLTVPVFRELSGRYIDAIPLDVATRLLDNTDVNGWLVSKHALHEISIRLWLKRKVEHSLTGLPMPFG